MTSPANKMTIYVGSQTDGCTFELEPHSRERLRSTQTEEGPLPRSVFIGCDTREDFVHVLGREELRWMVAEILTGLRREELDQVGHLEFLDPAQGFAKFDP